MRTLKTFVAILAFVTAISYLGESHFLLDTLSNLRVHFAAAFLILAAALAISRSGRWLAFSGLGLAVNLAPVVPWYLPEARQPVTAAVDGIKVLESNVYRRNTEYEKLEQLIDEEKPDVLGVVEVDSLWLERVPALRRDYAFKFEAPDDEYVGLALYSKLPLSDSRIVYFGESATPAIVSTLHMPNGEVELILAHPMPPLNARLAERRNAQLREMANYLRATRRPVLLVADLNAPMWNPQYRLFAKHSGLHNARAGYGIGPTWPAVPPFGIPIDHIMATAPSQLGNFAVHHGIGSDHLPISAEFSLPVRRNARNYTEVAKQ